MGETEQGEAERLSEVKSLSEELRAEIAGAEGRLHARLDQDYVRIREEIAKVHNDGRQLNAELHAYQRTIVQTGAGIAIFAIALAGLLLVIGS